MSWTERAACSGLDPDLFHPPELRYDDGCQGYTEDQLQAAYGEGKKICKDCPVRDACQTYACETKERYGLWGGLTPIERLRIERKHRRQRLKARRSLAEFGAAAADTPLGRELQATVEGA